MSKIGYARVSTRDQNLNSQIDVLNKYGCDRIFSEKVSGRKYKRTELDKCLDYLREGDTLVITKLDRLGRTTKQLNDILISGIPQNAYNYIVNGRPAVEWIMDQYQIKTDKKSGITDDPNLYSNDEKYIFNLLLRIINVSIKTVDLVNSLAPLEIAEE